MDQKTKTARAVRVQQLRALHETFGSRTPPDRVLGPQVKPEPMPPVVPEPSAKVPKARGTVARGHTVEVPTGERYVRATANDGSPIFAQHSKKYGPGQEVSLPKDEIERLITLGFLVDPNAVPPSPSDDELATFRAWRAEQQRSGGPLASGAASA
jgi:hypothetical protein